jgi:hypothetical protein
VFIAAVVEGLYENLSVNPIWIDHSLIIKPDGEITRFYLL